MITLEEYKEYLINTYKYQIDNTEEKRKQRKIDLSKLYNNDYLNKIIKDTANLIKILSNIYDKNYLNIKMSDCNINYISLNLTGGWFSDIIYKDIEGNLISDYILKKIIGNQLIIDIKEIEIEYDTDDHDIISYDYEYYIYLQNFQNKQKKLTKQISSN